MSAIRVSVRVYVLDQKKPVMRADFDETNLQRLPEFLTELEKKIDVGKMVETLEKLRELSKLFGF